MDDYVGVSRRGEEVCWSGGDDMGVGEKAVYESIVNSTPALSNQGGGGG